MNQLPIMVDLKDRCVVVVGGGAIAQQKVETLLSAAASVRLISPTLTERLTQLASEGQIDYRAKRFEESDLDGTWLVIAATDNSEINERVYQAAEERRIFCNTVDYRPLCSFITPAIVERGEILVAISTQGGSPALAQELKRVIATAIGDEYVEFLEMLRNLRPTIRRDIPDQTVRSRVFHKLVDSDILALLRAGKRSEAEASSQTIINSFTQS